MKKILIVGGSGFVGRNLTEYLAEKYTPCQIYTTYNNDNSFPEFAQELGVEPLKLDWTDSNGFSDLPECELCFFVGGNSNHALTPYESIKNIEGVINFLQWYEGRLIFVSSGAVYYGLEGRVDESAAINPTFPYGIGKLAMEQYVQYFYKLRDSKDFVILRLFYAFGRWERKTRLFRQVIESTLSEEKILVNGEGSSIIDPLSINDVVRIVEMVAFNNKCSGHVINLSYGKPYSVKNMIETVFKVADKTTQVKFDGVPEQYPVKFWGDTEKLYRLVEYTPHSIEERISGYMEFVKSE